MVRPIVAVLGDDNSDCDHTGAHDDGSNLKEGLATNTINDQLWKMLVRNNYEFDIVVTYHSGNGADKENDTCDTCCEQGDGSTSET